MLKVSIVIPVYNVAKYLERCLESLINQTLKDIEIICVNDNSTDNSLNILNFYAAKDQRIKVINFEKNQGVSAARNAGLDIAKGEYIGFVDSDDWVDLNFYENLYCKAKETNSDVVKAERISEPQEGQVTNKLLPFNTRIKINPYNFLGEFTTAIYKKMFLQNNKIIFPVGVKNSEDVVFLVKLISAKPDISFDDKTKYHYFQRDDSNSHILFDDEMIDAVICSFKEILETLDISDVSEENYLAVCNIRINYFLDKIINSYKNDKQQIFAKYLKFYEAIKKYIKYPLPHSDINELMDFRVKIIKQEKVRLIKELRTSQAIKL